MKDTKLIQILKTFAREEIKEFEKFVASPYFSRGRDLKPLYKILKSYHPEFNNQNFIYEKIFRKLYPKEKYSKSKSDNVLRVLSSELTKLAEEYIIVSDLRSNKLRSIISLLEHYVNNNLNKFYISLYSDTKKNLHKLIDGYTGGDFVHLYFLSMMEVIFSVHNNGKSASNMESQLNMMNFFSLCAANFINNSYNARIRYNLENKDDLVEQFMRNFDHKNFISYLDKKKGIAQQDKEIFELCFYGLLYTIHREDKNIVAKIESLFYKNKHLFRDNHKLSFYYLLKSYYNREKDFEKLNTLYESLLEDEVYVPHTGGEMPFILYNDILYNLIAQNKLTNARKFILKYTDYLRTDKKESFHNYGFAQIEFKKKNFVKSLEHISKVEMLTFFFKYEIRNLFLKLYYELNYIEEAYSLLDAYKHFLKSNKNVSEEMRLQNKLFVDYYKKVLGIKLSENKSALGQLKKNISCESKLMYKNWFMEKIEEHK